MTGSFSRSLLQLFQFSVYCELRKRYFYVLLTAAVVGADGGFTVNLSFTVNLISGGLRGRRPELNFAGEGLG